MENDRITHLEDGEPTNRGGKSIIPQKISVKHWKKKVKGSEWKQVYDTAERRTAISANAISHKIPQKHTKQALHIYRKTQLYG